MAEQLYFRNTVIGALPVGWNKVKIDSSLIDNQGGFSFARKHAVSAGLPHLRPFNITEGGEVVLTEDTVQISPDHLDNIEDYYLRPGDVLFNNTNSVELVGKTGIVREPMQVAFSNHINRLRVRDKNVIEPKWLALALQNLQRQGFFALYCRKWIGQAGFSLSELSHVEIPLPDVAEQRRIVAQIEVLLAEVREMRQLHGEITADANQLMRAILAETFPADPDSATPGWRWIRLGTLGTVVGGGTPRKAEAAYWGGTIPWVSPKDMKVRTIEDTQDHLTQFALDNSSARLIPAKSVLVVFRSGILAHSLPLAIAGRDLTINQDMKAILPHYDYIPEYIVYALQAREQYLVRNTVKKGPTVHSIVSDKFWQERIPIPNGPNPLASQRQIAAYLNAVQVEIEEVKENQAEDAKLLDRVEQAILAQAFRGEL